MKLQDIYQYFQSPQPIFLNQEMAVCYVLAILSESDSYGTEFIQQLEMKHAPHRLSDTVLYGALKFLEKEAIIQGYWQKVVGRGRPRRMYRIEDNSHAQARELGQLWLNYIEGQGTQHIGHQPLMPSAVSSV
jgi:DNA-binding PadR family transcriptional regulator